MGIAGPRKMGLSPNHIMSMHASADARALGGPSVEAVRMSEFGTQRTPGPTKTSKLREPPTKLLRGCVAHFGRLHSLKKGGRCSFASQLASKIRCSLEIDLRNRRRKVTRSVASRSCMKRTGPRSNGNGRGGRVPRTVRPACACARRTALLAAHWPLCLCAHCLERCGQHTDDRRAPVPTFFSQL